jgi:Ca2+-binding RTX toxin-like protein
MITDFERQLARLSSHVYDRLAMRRTPLPTGWSTMVGAAGGPSPNQVFYKSDDGDGFSAGAYRGPNNTVAIVFTGTNQNFTDYLNGNIPAGIGRYSDQVEAAIRFVSDVMAEIAAEPGTEIIFSGHSLGGGLASLMSVFFNRAAVVFDPAPFRQTALDPFVIGDYFDAYEDYQNSKGGRTIDAEFEAYDDALLPGPLLAAREPNIYGYYLTGESLESMRFPGMTIALGALTPVDVDGSSLYAEPLRNPIAEAAVTLHSMDALALSMVSDTFREALDTVRPLFELMANESLYGGESVGGQPGPTLLQRLARYESGGHFDVPGPAVTIEGNQAATRLANDATRLVVDATSATALEPLQRGLIAVLLERYYFGTPTDSTSTPLFFQNDGEAIQFDVSQIASSTNHQGRDELVNNLMSLVETTRPASLRDLLTQASLWTVQNKDEGLATSGSAAAEVQIGAPNDQNVLNGAGGNDVLIGGFLADVLHGGTEDDHLYGGGGSDGLNGNAGSDYLFGGSAADTLVGGTGVDYLAGGEGDDDYQFATGDGVDTIVDSDGQGHIFINGTLVEIGSAIALERWLSGNGLYTIEREEIAVSGGTHYDVIIRDETGSISITIRNWSANGQMGLTFGSSADPAPTSSDLYGSNIPPGTSGSSLSDLDNLRGSGGADTIFGAAGSDALIGRSGIDKLFGDIGSDVLIGGSDGDYLSGGNDHDLIVGDWQDSHVAGTLYGSPSQPFDNFYNLTVNSSGYGWGTGWHPAVAFPIADWREGLIGQTGITFQSTYVAGGADSIDAGEGDDWVYAGDGDDTVLAGDGNDVVFGHAGIDTLEGGSGDDYMFGDGHGQEAEGINVWNWEYSSVAVDGDDELRGGDGADNLWGQGGNDRLFGDDGDDFLFGDDNRSDALILSYGTPISQHGDDYVEGGAGEDVIEGGAGRDTLHGGSEDDFIHGDAATVPAADHDDDVLDGGSGNDILVGGGGSDRIQGGDGDDFVAGDSDEEDLPGASHSSDQLDGGAGSDTLIGGGSHDMLVGGEGNDALWGDQASPGLAAENNGNDSLNGGAGDDTLIGGGANDTLTGGDGNDVLYGDDITARVAVTAHGDDTLDGGAGDDTLIGWGGKDSLRGGDGDDELYGDSGALNDADHGDDILDGGSGNDFLRGEAGNDILIGGTGNDVLTGDTESGGTGDDMLYGGDGDDDLFGRGGADVMTGDAGNDDLRGEDGNDSLFGGDGTDFLAGGAGNDVLKGGDGNDELRGEAGNNDLDGGTGTDLLRGDTGNDTYRYNRNSGADFIEDTGGSDRIVLGAGITISDVQIDKVSSGSTADLVISIDGSGSSLRVRNHFLTGGARAIESIEFADGTIWNAAQIAANTTDLSGTATVVTGTSGNDTYVVDHPNDRVTEVDGGGNDLILASVSFSLNMAQSASNNYVENLTLTGTLNIDGVGNILDNTLIGNSADNTLDGGAGADTLSGGAGDDTYVVRNDDSNDFEDSYLGGTNDVVVELADEGFDTVIMRSWSATLTANVEQMILAPVIATWTSRDPASDVRRWMIGNSLDNILDASSSVPFTYAAFGGVVDLVLDGGAGADVLIGGRANEFYIVDDAGDAVIETGVDDVGNQLSIDTVETTISYALNHHIETLTLRGTAAISGTGNYLDNTLDGSQNSAANALIGGRGDDRYILGAGDSVVEEVGEGIDIAVLTTGTVRTYLISEFSNVEGIELTNALAASSITGGPLDDILIGNASANVLTGGAGNDTLDGRSSGDTLIGGLGDDTYVAYFGSTFTENAGEGIDLLLTSGQFTLPDNIENLTMTGTSNSDAFGNSLDNVMTSNAGANTLRGEAGNDTYVFNSLGDDAIEDPGEGTDLVLTPMSYVLAANIENLTLTGSANIDATGNAFANVLLGNSGANSIDGAAGADMMVGGDGNDNYYVDDAGDVVTEEEDGGIDTVQSSITYALAPHIEYLFLTGSAFADGIGNELDNTLGGNIQANELFGGLGNDTYFFDNTGDTFIEYENEGIDNVQSLYSVSLEANIENLTLLGAGAITGSGNDLDNVLTGNDGNNALFGGGGNDFLNGRAGADTLVGGLGNDTYQTEVDTVIENEDEGIDLVISGLDYTLGANVENLTLTFSALIGTGNELSNTIVGTAGDNTLDGGEGADTLIGGLGSDTYYVDHADDMVIDDSPPGEDNTIYASVSYTLQNEGQMILRLTGSGNINATGNASTNWLYGNTGDNVLDGGGDGQGGDQLRGGLGNDTYIMVSGSGVEEFANEGIDLIIASATFSLGNEVHVENLTLSGNASIDGTGNQRANTITGNVGDNVLDGVIGDDTLHGGEGNDTLDGGVGSDSMSGGLGDDVYFIDVATDTVIEAADEGIDLVNSIITYTLTSGVENLTLGHGLVISGTGNELDNVITGTNLQNTLNGGAGADTLIGGLSSDTYVVDNAGDTIIEASGTGSGTDLVQATVSYQLSSNVENLTLLGTADINGTGNASNNTLVGNVGNNTLDGGAGVDSASGGAGNDIYIVDSTSDVSTDIAGGGMDEVWASANYTLSSEVENLLLTGTSNINGTGNGLANSLTGNSGSNTLNGAGGADTMTGGLGNDTYVIDTLSDVVVENSGEGVDLIQSSVSWTLGSEFENLTLTLSGVISGTGNDLDNVLIGNSANNTLTGGLGNDTLDGQNGSDTLIGGTGDDTYIFAAGDTVIEVSGEGIDTVQTAVTHSLAANVERLVLTGGTAINGTGNDLDNELFGNTAANTLSGGLGADAMTGGSGNDTYVVENVGDTTVELAGGGTDLVQSSINFTLAANVENLTLTGSAGLSGTGNDLDNVLTGNGGANSLTGGGGNDTLNGGAGADTLTGGLGDDIYVVDTLSDVLVEASAEGTDTIQTGLTFSLGDHFENLTLTSTGSVNGTGNSLDNVITGGSGANILDGGAGNDTLVGGGGNDTYVVDSSSDTVTEGAGAGTDTVQTSASYVLSANVENLTLTGGSVIDGTGNSLANVITGNSAANTLTGGAGNDTYVVQNTDDVIIENSAEGTDLVQSSVTFTLAAEVEDLTLTGSSGISGTGNGLNNSLTGNTGANTLTGEGGNDTLNGGGGADTLIGGAGDDTYVFDNASDTASEAAGEGIDTVQSSVTATLSGDVENLTLTSSSTVNATGNALDNILMGGSGTNTLDGGVGADTMIGGGGNDTYVVDNVGDTVTEGASAGTDQVNTSVTYTLTANVENITLTGASAIDATGNTLANVITGNSAANTLTGGAGNDTYVVQNTDELIVENTDEGTDLVQASVSFTLAGNIENLTLTGSSGISATGNALDNVLTGNTGANTLTGGDGNDRLSGGTGADTMIGGIGNDTYVVDNAGDSMTEASGEGTDLVESSITHTLGSDIENLTLTGSSTGVHGTGNALDNILIGNSQANTLTGNGGNDTLDGGSGNDTMLGGQGDDIYFVNATGDVTTESAGQGLDLVNSGVTRTLGADIEMLFLTGSSNNSGTGNTLSNLLRGNTGTNTLSGGEGIDILEGGGGTDTLSNNNGGNSLLNGGAAVDTLTGTANNDLLIGGTGNDSVTTGAGADLIAFNKGDGQDTVAVSVANDNTITLGGGALYADLLFQKSGNNLVLKVGASDQITLTDYYANPANRSIDKLQIVIEGTTDYDAGSGDATRNKKIATFDFDGMVAAFDAALVVDPGLTSWALTNALAAQHLGGSDTEALGGDLAYQYSRFGNLAGISFTPAIGILSAGGFGTTAQALQSSGSLQDASPRLT